MRLPCKRYSWLELPSSVTIVSRLSFILFSNLGFQRSRRTHSVTRRSEKLRSRRDHREAPHVTDISNNPGAKRPDLRGRGQWARCDFEESGQQARQILWARKANLVSADDLTRDSVNFKPFGDNNHAFAGATGCRGVARLFVERWSG